MNPFAEPYPLNALPVDVRSAAFDVLHFVQCTDVQVGLSLIISMVIPCQALADFKNPFSDTPCTLSINAMNISESSERTSSTDLRVLAPIIQHDAKAQSIYDEALKAYRARHAMWMNLDKAFQRRWVRLNLDGKDTAVLDSQIEEHQKKKPEPPRLQRYIRQDTTARSVMDAVAGHNKTLAFLTDEGHTLFNSDLMRNIGRLNSFWDGAAMMTLDRAEGESVVAQHARVSMYFKVHEPVLQKYLAKHGEAAHGAGLWARFLVAMPNPRKGLRQVIQQPFESPSLARVHARVVELMAMYDEKIAAGPFERDVVELCDDARNLWFRLAEQVERDQRPGGWLHAVSAHASKHMEITGRLAAVFHYFSGAEGKISATTLENAHRVAAWHLCEYVRIFSPHGTLSPTHAAAVQLLSYLHRFWSGMCNNTVRVARSDILKRGPTAVRNADRLDAVLRLLVARFAITVVREPTEKQKEYIVLQDNYFMQWMQQLY